MEWLDNIRGGSRQVFRASGLRWRFPPNKVVIHSTEGGGYPSPATYGHGLRAPHITIHVRERTFRQHYPFSRPAYALKAGRYSTNTAGAIQVEVIGTCDPRNKNVPSILTFDDGDLLYLALVLDAICEGLNIPKRTMVSWLPYPASYGNTGVRLSANAWYNYSGICGHQHVPHNSHGDPGSLDIARVVAFMNTGVTSPLPPPNYDGDFGMFEGCELARIDGTNEVYIGNGLIRRWVRSEQELDDIQWRMKHFGVPNTVNVVSRLGYLGEDITRRD